MKTLSKAEIFAAPDIQREPFPVPEWGEDAGIYLVQLSGIGRASITAVYQDFKDSGAAKQSDALQDAMMIACVTDDGGTPIFTADDLPALRAKNGVVLERIVKAALALNGMGAKAEDAAVKP